ncbi:UNVERIFIED_ORG: PAS domain S-box-containing protein [Zoogloea ramigera]|uniref:histidine kinase n=1 Tax=Duganella zoogloeoides TaxID=75659 RepID=A0ABZ0Y6B1_9BURK|nr:PAS domain-containing protein [Duganella zoogloeoides]WQH07358.1 PAS domain-containing protein [Duganella zoogloeoides]
MPHNSDPHAVELGDAQTILDSITDAFFTLNRNWEFAYVNRRTEQVLGHAASDLIGRSIWEVFPGTVGSEFERVYRAAANTRTAASFHAYYPDHDRWYDVNVYPAEGGLSIYFRDISERMKEETLRQALSSLSDVLRNLTTPEDIAISAAEALGRAVGASRVGYATIGANAETLHVVREWQADGIAPQAEQLSLRDVGMYIDDLKQGKLVAVDEVPAQASTAAALVHVPLLERGRLVAILYVNHATARRWTPAELAFIREVADRTRIASERQRHVGALAELAAGSDRRRRLYETFLENSPDLAYVFDLDHRFTYANKVLLQMWQRTWEESIGKNCLELGYEPWHAELHDREIELVVASKQSVRGEVPFDGGFGRRIYEYIFVPVFGPDGEVEAIAGTTRDVTDRKQAEQALEQASQRKDEFLAMLAHELRNPLAPISAAAEMLDQFASDEQIRKRSAGIILRQVKHMTALVDDLVDVSRVTQGLVDIERVPLDLAPVVDSAIEQVRAFIESRQQQLRVRVAPAPVFVLGDHKRLVQIVTNLLGNATKYTPAGGAIDIHVTATPDTITLSVEDNGIGMATELQSRVFELFTQAKRTSDRSQGGLGIGLALAKSLTEMHGGDISCFSNGEGTGSRFTVTLPKHIPLNGDSSAQARALEPWQLPADGPLRILVVDDNEDAASTLAQYLEAYGHQTFVEHLPGSALLRAQLEKPDVCILDIGLPEMDGNELARRLRSQPETKHALLVALTGYAQEKDKLATQAAGFDQFFSKPLDTGKLLALLRHRRS